MKIVIPEYKTIVPDNAKYVVFSSSGLICKIISDFELESMSRFPAKYNSYPQKWREKWCSSIITIYFEEDVAQLIADYPELII